MLRFSSSMVIVIILTECTYLGVPISSANRLLTSFYTSSIKCSDIESTGLVSDNYCNVESKARIISADFNSDSYCDVSCIGEDGKVYVRYGTGNAVLTYSSNYVILPSGFYGSEEGCFPVAADVDKDGYDDIVWACDDVAGDNLVRAYVIKGQSADFIPPVTVLVNITIPSAAFDDHGGITGDFDGDGYCDILCHISGVWQLHRSFIVETGIITTYCPRRSLHYLSLLPHYNGWCGGSYTLAILDINSDGNSDILCIYPDGIGHRIYITAGSKSHTMTLSTVGSPIMQSDVIQTGLIDPQVPCSVSLKVIDNDQATVNPCENVTRNAAYFQADSQSVLDVPDGSFCLNHSVSNFLSADIDGNGYCDMICHDNANSPNASIYIKYLQDNGRTYETRQNLLSNNIKLCSTGKLYTMDYNADKRFDLICSNGEPLECNKVIDVTYLLSGNTDGINLAGVWTDAKVLGAVILGSFACGECPSISERDDVVVSYDEGRYMNKMAKVKCQSKFKALRGISNPFCRLMWEGGKWRCEDWSKPVQNYWKVYAAKCVPAKPWRKIGISNEATCMKYCEQQPTCWFVTYNYLLLSCSMFTDYGLVSAIDNLPDNSACITFVLD